MNLKKDKWIFFRQNKWKSTKIPNELKIWTIPWKWGVMWFWHWEHMLSKASAACDAILGSLSDINSQFKIWAKCSGWWFTQSANSPTNLTLVCLTAKCWCKLPKKKNRKSKTQFSNVGLISFQILDHGKEWKFYLEFKMDSNTGGTFSFSLGNKFLATAKSIKW